METSDFTRLTEDLIQRFGSGNDFEGIMSGELFQQSNLYIDDQDEEETEPDDVIVVHMDIRQPLSSLQKIVEQKVGLNLKNFKFWLQDAQELEPHKNLVDQCVKGEGLVQINVQIQTIARRINIVDVLKPTEAALAELANEETNQSTESTKVKTEAQKSETQDSDNSAELKKKRATNTSQASVQERPCLNWVLDSKFKKEQARLKIPDDPYKWTVPQVKHWFQWAMRQFELTDITMSDWTINGKDLCSLTHEEFRKKLPSDPGNVFWTHLQLLKECKFVSIVHKAAEASVKQESSSNAGIVKTVQMNFPQVQKEQKIMRKTAGQTTKTFPLPSEGVQTAITTHSPAFGVGSGNNGQVQLWQFLLEILTDREHVDIIQWVGTQGEFKLTDPEKVAHLWGVKKKKPAMNYEKLSRALRYYYDGDMISKVAGKRFAYKFDCDLKLLIGYDAAELSRLVNEKSYVDGSLFLEHMQSDDE